MRVAALFAGIGGLERGLSMAIPMPVEVGLVVERDPRCLLVLRREYPGAEVCMDVRDFGKVHGYPAWRPYILTAGFPCQPHSTASRGRRVATDLWGECRRVISEWKPRVVILENVQRAPIVRAAEDLHMEGFSCAVAPLSSSQVGAPDDRRRYWAIAHAHDSRQSAVAIHAQVARLPSLVDPGRWGSSPGGLLGMDDGVSDRSHRLRMIGNAVNPYQAAAAIRWLVGELVSLGAAK